MTVPLARTSQEAHLCIDLTPCSCGETRFPRSGVLIDLPGGEPARRYRGQCPSCGAEREFLFRLPAVPEDVTSDDEIVYGLGTRPSELIDPGQWLWAADRYAAAVPADPERLDGDARRLARTRLQASVAALEEVAKFIPEDAGSVPASAFWTAPGRAEFARAPGRFDRARLEAVRETYERVLRRMASPPGPLAARAAPDRRERLVAADRARAAWAAKYGIDGEAWTEEDATGPARRAPTPEQAGELQETLRQVSGQDTVTGLSLDSPAGALAAYEQLLDSVHLRWSADRPERDRRLALAEAVHRSWRERLTVDHRSWPRDAWSIPDAELPPAGPAWEMVRAARAAAGEP